MQIRRADRQFQHLDSTNAPTALELHKHSFTHFCNPPSHFTDHTLPSCVKGFGTTVL